MLTKTITIDGREVTFATSARTPRLYRKKFQKDLIQDFTKLQKAYKKAKNKEEQLQVMDLEMFENIAYIMAYQANENIGKIDDWLDEFNTFDIYEVFPKIMELWADNNKTIVEAKKKQGRQ